MYIFGNWINIECKNMKRQDGFSIYLVLLLSTNTLSFTSLGGLLGLLRRDDGRSTSKGSL
jgi:hypothetical protein